MKRTILTASLVLVLASVFVLGIASTPQPENKSCSNAFLSGSFGITGTGTVLGAPPPLAGPIGEVGRQTFDGNGNTHGTATLSQNGIIIPITWDGTYTVNPDCTCSLVFLISPVGRTVHANLVLDDDGTEFRAIGADPGSVFTVAGKKQFRKEE